MASHDKYVFALSVLYICMTDYFTCDTLRVVDLYDISAYGKC
jgi:hypothetical protein